MAKKRYYIEQVDEEEKKKEPMKEQAEDNKSGILSKDVDASTTSKSEQPVNTAVPKEPLDKAKALTEEAGVADNSDVLNQILTALTDLKAEIASMKASSIGPKTEEAVGFEGDTPSGPSYSNPEEGGVQNDEEDTTLKGKVADPVEKAIPDEDLEKVNQLTEKVGKRKTIIDSRIRENMNPMMGFKEALKNYANKI